MYILFKLILILGVMTKKGQSQVIVKPASQYTEKSKSKQEESESEDNSSLKLVNLVYNEGTYYAFEGKNKDANKFNIIDNHLWYITKFMPEKRVEVKEGDVIRFGRIPFKIAKMVLTEDEEDEDEAPGAVLDANGVAISQMDISQADLHQMSHLGD